MKNALKLYKTDLKRVAKTPAVWVILLGLAILPSFYAWFNLWAMWDPYSNTDHVKVAVVGGTFCLAVARGGGPGAWQIVQAVPVDARHAADQQLRGAA